MGTIDVFAGVAGSFRRFSQELEDGRVRQPALARFVTAADVVAALSPPGEPRLVDLPEEERGALVAALIAERQRAPHELWQAMLVVAFAPMLRSLRKRLRPNHDEDLDQTLLVAFLESTAAPVVATAGAFAPIALRRATKRAVDQLLAASNAEPPAQPFDEELHGGATDLEEDGGPAVDARAEQVRAAVHECAGSAEMAEVVLATCAGNESLADYVARTFSQQSPEQRELTYERLRKGRARALLRLRTRLAPLVEAR